MGGSGGGGSFWSGRTPDNYRQMVERQESRIRDDTFASELSAVLGELLGGYNARDTLTANDRLDEIKDGLSDTFEGGFDSLFGGSVAKHTYVDGLSDIDSLVLINDSSLEGQSPEAVLKHMARVIKKDISEEARVSHGNMAVTVEYADGMCLQLLPALKDGDRVRVPSSSKTQDWSKIDPIKFNKALTKANAKCGGKLVPTIKLAKAAISALPESQRLSGYHVESLAIAAFRNYEGEKSTSAMLPHFFSEARTKVLSPIRDRSGQSVNVDDYLGKERSDARQTASRNLGRIERKMSNATKAGSLLQWRDIFGA